MLQVCRTLQKGFKVVSPETESGAKDQSQRRFSRRPGSLFEASGAGLLFDSSIQGDRSTLPATYNLVSQGYWDPAGLHRPGTLGQLIIARALQEARLLV